MTTWRVLLALPVLFVLSAPAAAEPEVRFSPDDVRSVVYVAKSENRNQVHYALDLDARCAPASPAPLRPYRRMRERGDAATEPLLSRERRAYGIKAQRVEGTRVVARLFALPDRELVIEPWRGPRGCEARVVTSIGRARARLDSVYVKLGFPFRVEYLLLQGNALDDGRAVRERLTP